MKYFENNEKVKFLGFLVIMFTISVSIVKAQLSFTDSEQSFGSNYKTGIVFGDVNGDGYKDAIVTYSTAPTKVWLNNKEGRFTDSGQSLSSGGAGMTTGSVLGDLDRDGDLDAFIIYSNEAAGNGKPNEVWMNDGTGIFTNSGQKLGKRCSTGVALADLDGDGDLDAFVCNHICGINTLTGSQVWMNDGTGIFTDSGQDLGILNHNHYSVNLGDIDGDADIDAIVTSGGNNTTSKNEIWINDGKGNYTSKVLSTTDSQGLAMGDIDKDGDSDILITYSTGAKIFLNDGKGNLTLGNQNFGTTGSYGVVLGDLDKDDDLDAIIQMKGGTNSIIWTNEGNGTFKETKINLLLGNGGSLRLVDLNNDGLLDVLAGSKIFFNNNPSSNNTQSNLTANIYASYFGGSGEELSSFVAVDREGNVIIAGTTNSRNLSIKPTNQKKYGGGEYDGFVVKLSPDMKEVVFLTYLGAAYSEIRNVAVDSANNIYITGNTTANFPVTNNALYKTYQGGIFDGFLNKYNPDGQLLYSTYIGGNTIDIGMAISIINTDEVLLAGITDSNKFPVKPALSYTNKGGFDVFLLKLNISNNSLVFSSCLGGSSSDFPKNIKTDQSGNIYISGNGSSGFPVVNGFNSKFGEYGNGFITKFNNNGDLIYSSKTFDGLVSIDLNEKGEVYFASNFTASGLACSKNAFFTERKGGSDMLIGKINSEGDSILYLSYFGGTGDDSQKNISFIGNDKVVVTGITKSSDFPVSIDTSNKTAVGTDVSISVLDIAKKKVLYSNYIGGSADEELWNSTMQNDSVVFICGTTKSSDFPLSSDAYTKKIQGVSDAVFARFKFEALTIKLSESSLKMNSSVDSKATFNIVSNTSWIVTSSEAWSTVNPASGSNNATITLTAAANNTRSTRTATINVSCYGANTQTINVTQEAGTTGMNSIENNKISVIPNSTSGLFTLSFGTTPPQQAIASIFNTEGKLVITKTYRNTTNATIDLKGQSKGMYLLRLTENGKIFSDKLFLE